MAAAVDADEDFLQCSICIEDYTRPRKLPKCGHTFCEDCLVAYAKKLKDTKKNSQGFPCPLCRGINAAATDLIDPEKWVEKLEINVDAVRRLTTKVTNGTQFCNPCLELQRFSNTGWFCFECRDMLCRACYDMHRVCKASRHHSVVRFDGDKYERKSFETLSQYIACSDHADRPVEYMCTDDDSLICAVCSTDRHRNCKQVTKLNNIDLNTSDKNVCQALKRKITKLSSDVRSHIEARTIVMTESKNRKDRICTELETVRVKLVKTVDGLYKKPNKHLTILSKFNEISAALEDLLNVMDLVIKHGKESQIFIVMHKVKRGFFLLKNAFKEVDKKIAKKKTEPDKAFILKHLLGVNYADKSVQVEESVYSNKAIQTETECFVNTDVNSVLNTETNRDTTVDKMDIYRPRKEEPFCDCWNPHRDNKRSVTHLRRKETFKRVPILYDHKRKKRDFFRTETRRRFTVYETVCVIIILLVVAMHYLGPMIILTLPSGVK